MRNTNDEAQAVQIIVNLAAEGQVYFFLDYQAGASNSLNLFNDARRISKKIKVIVITSLSQPATMRNIRSYKPDGIISKLSGTDVITECLETIIHKQVYICPVTACLLNTLDATNNTAQVFSQREIEILTLFDKGLSISGAADSAHLSPNTIANHRSNMMKKSGTRSIVALLAYARSNDIL